MKLLMTGKESPQAGVMIPIPQYPLYTATIAEYNAYQVSRLRFKWLQIAGCLPIVTLFFLSLFLLSLVFILFDIHDTFKNKLYRIQIASDISATWTTMPRNQQITLIGIALQLRPNNTNDCYQQLRG